eukprot:2422310-Pleurochrysis_carterae.AAC.3
MCVGGHAPAAHAAAGSRQSLRPPVTSSSSRSRLRRGARADSAQRRAARLARDVCARCTAVCSHARGDCAASPSGG